LVKPLNAELNPICHLLSLLGGATIVVVSRLRVNEIVLYYDARSKKHQIKIRSLPSGTFTQNRAIREIMCQNTVEPDKIPDDNTIGIMRIEY